MNGVKVRFLNRDEIFYRLVDIAKRLLAKESNVIEVSLFGSLAKGNYTPRSDIDIFILLNENSKKFIDRIPGFLDYFEKVGLTVEVFPYTLEEINKMKNNHFIRTIYENKIILASRLNPNNLFLIE